MHVRLATAVALALLAGHPVVSHAQVPTRLQYFTGGLQRPTDVAAPVGDNRLFITEQETGRIRIVDAAGNVSATPFLTITNDFSFGGERGLLGLAFHPNHVQNGYFFITYTDAVGRLVLARYRRSPWNGAIADTSSLRILFKLDQPFLVHKGSDLAFGKDGFLYVSVGDAGGHGDATCRPQELDVLHGKILRIDVDKIDSTGTYGIPLDNPFVGVPGARGEILHLGLRNPWRFALDSLSGDLWIADVGQDVWEEVNWVDSLERGINFGWKTMEGPDCFDSPGCNGANYLPCGHPSLRGPIFHYGHADGCSIIGGAVYRGAAISAMQGMFLFADFCSSKVWAVRGYEGQLVEFNDLTAQLKATTNYSNPSVIAADGLGELVMATIGGSIFRFVPETSSATPVHPLTTDKNSLSLIFGGTQNLALNAGASRGGEFFIMVGSASGVHPGVPLDTHVLPLQYDSYGLLLLDFNSNTPLSPRFGYLDGAGRANATFALAPFQYGLIYNGMVLHHAFMTFDATFGLSFVSNPKILSLGI